MRSEANDIRRVRASGGAKDELERILRVNFHTGMLCSRVRHHRRNGGETLPVPVYVQRPNFCSGKLDGLPFKSDRRLGNVAHLFRDK